MKLDIIKALKAPFVFPEKDKLLELYSIATAVTLASALLFIIVLLLYMAISFGATAMLSDNVAGIIITIISVFSTIIFLIPFATPLGYITETMSREINGEDPILFSWSGKIKELTLKGFKFIVVFFIYNFIYTVIILLPLVLTTGLAVFTGKSSHDLSVLTGSIGGIISFVIIVIATIIFCLIIPMQWATLAETNSMWKALNIVHIGKKIILNLFEYILAYVVMIAFSIVFSIIATILAFTCVGILLYPLLFVFVVPVICYNLFAQVYKD